MVMDPPKKPPCPDHGWGGGSAVHLCIPIQQFFETLEAALSGQIAPDVAFPPPAASFDPDPCPESSSEAPSRLRASCEAADPSEKATATRSKTRVCVDCRRRRRIKFFYVNRESRQGRVIRCRECFQRRAAVCRSRHPEKAREWQSKAHANYARSEGRANSYERYRRSLKGHLTNQMSNHVQRSKRKGIEHDLALADLRAIRQKFFGRCAYCREPLTKYYFDHVFPVRDGGPDIPANLVPACRLCNRRKGRKNLYGLIASGWFASRKRIERVLAHCHTARGAEKVQPLLDRWRKEAGVGDPEMDALEPWLREAVTSGFISKTDAIASMREMGEEGLENLHELFQRFMHGQNEKESREEVA